jgi:hypothetical protein
MVRADEDALTQAIIDLASEYGRYAYRRITWLLKDAGWVVGTERVQRIWRREGLKVPSKQRPRSRLWLNDGSCIRRRPERRNHVWSYDFVEALPREIVRTVLAELKMARRKPQGAIICGVQAAFGFACEAMTATASNKSQLSLS